MRHHAGTPVTGLLVAALLGVPVAAGAQEGAASPHGHTAAVATTRAAAPTPSPTPTTPAAEPTGAATASATASASPDAATSPSPTVTPAASATAATAPSEPLPLRPAVTAVHTPTPPVQVYGSGWGHSVGMSQYGAYALSRSGRAMHQIVSHYYPGIRLDTRDTSGRVRVSLASNVTSTYVESGPGQVAIQWGICNPANRDPEAVVSHSSCTGRLGWGDQTTMPPGTRWNVTVAANGFTVKTTSGALVGGPLDVARLRVYLNSDFAYSVNPNRTSPTAYIYGFIDLVRTADNRMHVVADQVLEQYLRGLGEMPNAWGVSGGDAALQAQVVAARTFALTYMAAGRTGCSCDILATPANQAWIGYSKEQALYSQEWTAAVDVTNGSDNVSGRVLTYGGALAQAYYSSSHGGRSEAIEDSWAYGTTPVPYLRSVADPWSLDPGVRNPYRSWRNAYANTILGDYVGVDVVTRVAVASRTSGGTPRTLTVHGLRGGTQVTVEGFRGGNPAKPAGANLLRDVSGEDGRLRSQQIRRFGFLPFTDDDGMVHEYATVFAYFAGIAKGYDADTFGPGDPVTRGQMATFLYRTFAIPTGDPGQFSDVPGTRHADSIGAVADAGVASGYPDGSFRPDAPVTRAQMATFLAAALALDAGSPDRFTDVGVEHTHADGINAVAAEGIATGCTATRFCPSALVTRGQMSSFLHRSVESLR